MAVVFPITSTTLWRDLATLDLGSSVFVTPTDTVYGLGTRLNNMPGIQKIRTLKKRRDPFLILVSDFTLVRDLAKITEDQEAILRKHWPGAITFVLQDTTGEGTVAVRYPESPFLLRFLELLGGPIVSTSCNYAGEKPVTQASDAVKLFGDYIDFYVDGGIRDTSTSSTLVDLTTITPQITRQGEVTFRC